MVDIFALALSHGLLALVGWRLLLRPDLDVEGVRADRGRAAKKERAGKERPIRRGMTWRRDAGNGDAGGEAGGDA